VPGFGIKAVAFFLKVTIHSFSQAFGFADVYDFTCPILEYIAPGTIGNIG
jgi:hypothetical protein